ncbi:hypothetical protein [Motilimonas sp. E26]|uniref:hypothetical protein n=1 Tax=Motilimonas TaxID=1914248 RepID=UPI001E4645AB|nr:hypothetical protein [Motilimonas sp. E26]MCE0557222.1 hypothetical protein [Motilimonas sp. E26]
MRFNLITQLVVTLSILSRPAWAIEDNSNTYTQSTWRCLISASVYRRLGKVLIAGNGFPLSKSITRHKRL